MLVCTIAHTPHFSTGIRSLSYSIELTQCGEEIEADCANRVKEIITAYCDEYDDPMCSNINLHGTHNFHFATYTKSIALQKLTCFLRISLRRW